jgi:ABC-2 type transport system permease protein
LVDLPRVLTVAHLSFRSAFQGLRTWALGALAAISALVVLALVLAAKDVTTTENAAQTLFLTLTVRVVIGLVVLVIAAAQFRSDIEQDTLTYLSSRSVTRPEIVLGKYLGAVGASLVFLLPAGIAPLLIAGLGGAPPPPTAVAGSILAIVLLATFAYSAFFLFLGLVTRNALLLGLIFLFLWEELVLLLPGDFPKLSLLYYFQSFANGEVSSGPFSGSLTSVSPGADVLAPLIVAVFFVVLTAMLFRNVETAPQRTSA